nr:EOG090X0OE5 [Sida crystallina]
MKMAGVYMQSCLSGKWLQIDISQHPNSHRELQFSHEFIKQQFIDWHDISSPNVPLKIFHGIHEIRDGRPLSWSKNEDVFLNTSIPLVGGKGGFGSMLRAIGAQIEKTTNREACRDLSGRRLRDINEEKRLKDWVAKQADREREKEERKKNKLDKLKQEYRHEFHDPEYNKERGEVTDKVSEAIEQGIAASCSAEPETKKRKVTGQDLAKKKHALWLGVSDDDTNSDDSSSESEEKSDSSDSGNADQTLRQKNDASDSNQTEEMEGANSTLMESEDSSTTVKPTTNIEMQPKQGITELQMESVVSKQPDVEQVKEPIIEPVKKPVVEPVKEPVVEPVEPVSYLPIELEDYSCVEDLEALGLNHLKEELQRRGLKTRPQSDRLQSVG